MNLSQITKQAVKSLKKHSPAILTGIGIAGLLATTVLAVEATPKALKLIEEAKKEQGVEKLTAADTVKTAWKCYIPAATTAAASVACIVGASKVSASRNAALATAYTISETAAREYKEKVIETIGEKKEQEVRDSIAKNKLEKNPVSNSDIIVTGKGTTRCYDPWNDRRFDSDAEKIRKAVNDLNEQLLYEEYVSLNDFYYALGLDESKSGAVLGWNINKDGQVKIRFSAQVDTDGVPCLVLDFVNPPRYDFSRY